MATSKRTIRVRDLRPGDNGPGKPFLFCIECLSEWSADASDYFAAKPTTIIRCCGQPVHRAQRRSRLVAA